MNIDIELNDRIRSRLHEAQSILVLSHVRPDGDAIGSVLGLGLALQNAGKKVQMTLADGVPATFKHLPGSRQITRKPAGTFDLVVVVDCSDLERIGTTLNGTGKPGLNIDHHVTNLKFAEINLVRPDAVATSAILAERLPIWGFEVTSSIASALLTGVVSDSLGFRTSNTTAQSLRLAADLMETGANLPDLYQRALIRRSFSAALYWGEGLSRLQRDGRLIWTHLTLIDREKANYPGNDDADLVNVLSAIDEADVAVLFIEQKGGRTKVSWRSQPGIDVSQIAYSFGGGGHAAASGADITGSLEEVESKVLKATRSLLAERQNNI